MQSAKRILWGEGMFLRPQHFQQQTLHLEQQLHAQRGAFQRHDWGVLACDLDENALRNQRVSIDRLCLMFRDGTWYQAPQGAALPLSRSLDELPADCTSTTLYACLAHLHPYGGNARSEAPVQRPTRYTLIQQEVSDLYTQALEADLSLMELDIRLLFDTENRDGYDALPIARLVRDAAGHWQERSDYIPPLISVDASRPVQQMLRRLLDIMLLKSQSLTQNHRERAKNVLDYGSSDVGSFWLLHTINRNFARLRHLARCNPLHPEELYLALAELCGELSTFSNRLSLADIPTYQHDELQHTLGNLDLHIRELLETVISSRHVQIPLHCPRPAFHVGRLESDRLLNDADFYLSVRSEMPAAQLIEQLPLKLKIGAPDDVDRILNSALRGVSLIHTPQTPSALPVRVGNQYFALDPHGDIYARMLQARSICIYIPQTLAHVSLELMAVFR
jgi:type VI secretion system protein ImpJ